MAGNHGWYERMNAYERFTRGKLFEKLGYQYVYGPDIATDSESPERERFEDVVLFVNGLPLVVMELKNAADGKEKIS